MNELQVYQLLFGVTLACNIGLSITVLTLMKKLRHANFALGVSWFLRH